ncbi:MAG: D-alanine-D-alanine ligase [Candidatus Nomurabacteria bacterium GW2011_GWB1_37_5]|uniref:D-alanine-D-alanine ligase n=1 Tax=Candidatus Nomurabacteria bacterium GW2011_GWB1_37_5 TaxID=1618742 RepID=A0A0G0GX03_9BACT|nr:MAG: D-alanine-D-alanine ligase [Candidatus Nomurabacteria bacterium GW2011_GWB1_37_5]
MKINIGVLRGGISSEYDASLKTGGAVLSNLKEDKYRPVDILITKDGEWHADGMPIEKENLKSIVDVIWNGLHGKYGEDGQVQSILDRIGVPYTGPNSLAAKTSLNKHLAKKNLSLDHYSDLNIRMPYGEVVEGIESSVWLGSLEDIENYITESAKKVFNRIPPPWIVKPLCGGSSIDTYVANNFDQLREVLEMVLKNHEEGAIVEEYVRGREIVLGVIEDFRDKSHYSLLPLEIIKPREIFDHQTKSEASYRLISPSDLSSNEKMALQEIGKRIHRKMGLRHYSMIDLIINKYATYVLEVDGLPCLGEGSIFRESMESIGINFQDFLDHVITSTLQNSK